MGEGGKKRVTKICDSPIKVGKKTGAAQFQPLLTTEHASDPFGCARLTLPAMGNTYMVGALLSGYKEIHSSLYSFIFIICMCTRVYGGQPTLTSTPWNLSSVGFVRLPFGPPWASSDGRLAAALIFC